MTVNKLQLPAKDNAVQLKINEIIDNLDSGDTTDILIPVTYAELVELKTNSQLKEGAFYRITDYVTTTNGGALYNNIASSSRSVGHQFDIIIQALGTSNLSNIGTCALHEGDTYFANSNLGSWQIWYDIANDTNKYQWADATNGKGVIYRMIDERFNDLPYDFKNIQFSRNVANYSELSEYLIASDNYYYTFSFIQNNEIVDNSVSGNVAMCNYNTIEYATVGSNNSRALNNIVIIGNATYQQCTSNYIGRGTWELTATEYFYSNDIHGGSTYNNVFKMFYMNNCSNFFYNNKLICSSAYNRLGSNFHDNTVSSGTFAYNNIDNYCYNNTMSGKITYNIIGSTFHDNTISSTNFTTNKIGDVVYSNTFTGGNTRKNFIVGDCYNNTFNTFYLNFIGYYFAGNNVGANFGYNTILDTSSNNTFGTGCQGNVLLGYDANISFPNNCRALVVGRFVVGSSATNKLDLTGIPTGATYQITILRDVNNLPVAKWQDNNLEVGLYKTSLTASTWSDLVTTLTVEDWDV